MLIFLIALTAICLALTLGGIVSDCILSKSKHLNEWADTLPMNYEED